MSEIALRLRLAVWMMSSCLAEFPAATALAVAMVMPLVMRMNSSGVVVLLGASLDWNSWGRQSGWLSFDRRLLYWRYVVFISVSRYCFHDQPKEYS